MTMQERLFENPMGFFSGCIVWIPIAIWIVSIIGWMVQGDVEPGPGVLSIAAAFVLGYFAMMPPMPEMAPVFAVAAFSVIAVFPSMRASLNSRALAQIDIETIEKCYEMLREKPGNVGAQLRLARTLYVRGVRGQAVSIAEETVKNLPRIGFEEEMRQVRQWKANTVKDDFRPIVCVECGNANEPKRVFCACCNSPFLLDYVKGRWIGRKQARRLLVTWTAMVAALGGIPLCISQLPGVFAYLGSAGVLIGAVAAVLYVFRAEAPATA